MRLETNWLTDGHIDFEYKKYLLLSYFKRVKKSFNSLELYPFMSDLVFHYNNILDFKNNKTIIQEKFPVRLKDVDIKELKLLYQRLIDDDEMMTELETIIHFALPLFKDNLEEGKEIYEFVEKNTELTTVGLMPLYTDEGYFFIEQASDKVSYVYRYQMTVFQRPDETLRGIHASELYHFKRSIGESYEKIKLKLTKQITELPNPATFLINTKIKFPKEETLIPIAKRLLVKYISTA